MHCGALHRLLVVTFAVILYGGTYAFASEAGAAPTSSEAVTAPARTPGDAVTAPARTPGEAVTAPARTAPPLEAPRSLAPDARGAEPAGTAPAPKPAPAQGEPQVPHIALLLPLESPSFAKHAEAVRNGFLAAAKVQRSAPLPLRIYPVGDDERSAVDNYRRALENGARLVVGPLTRNGVSAIADSALVIVPTIALNVPDRAVAGQRDLYVLSLHAESEARQVAQLAWQDGKQNAITLNADSPLLKRLHQAFVEEFTRLGGRIVAEYAFSPGQAELARIKQGAGLGVADMVFLALDYRRARLARAYLGTLAVYATSHVYPGNTGPLGGFDLANIRFLDMPWLLQPDHPAVMVYPRQDYRDPDLDRFYALGIDAFRVTQELLSGKPVTELDGVIGRLKLGADHHFSRTLTAAQFTDGKVRITVETVNRGDAAEALAAAFLEERGLRILARNYRCKAGEIDLVARSGATMVFVEVRARRSGTFGGAAGSITAAKRKRILVAARHYLTSHRMDCACRLDVVLLMGEPPQIEWIRDAFGE